MDIPETVMVQPVRTFLEGAELKTPESEPYPVSRSQAVDLRGNGLVAFDDPPPEPEPEPAPAAKPKGRRSA